jgi:hypothetical protein
MWSMEPQCDWTNEKEEESQDFNGYTERKTKDEKTIAPIPECKQGFNACHLEKRRIFSFQDCTLIHPLNASANMLTC